MKVQRLNVIYWIWRNKIKNCRNKRKIGWNEKKKKYERKKFSIDKDDKNKTQTHCIWSGIIINVRGRLETTSQNCNVTFVHFVSSLYHRFWYFSFWLREYAFYFISLKFLPESNIVFIYSHLNPKYGFWKNVGTQVCSLFLIFSLLPTRNRFFFIRNIPFSMIERYTFIKQISIAAPLFFNNWCLSIKWYYHLTDVSSIFVIFPSSDWYSYRFCVVFFFSINVGSICLLYIFIHVMPMLNNIFYTFIFFFISIKIQGTKNIIVELHMALCKILKRHTFSSRTYIFLANANFNIKLWGKKSEFICDIFLT